MAEEVGSHFQVRGSLCPTALPRKPSLRPGFMSPAAAPVSSCLSWQKGRQSSQEPEFRAPQSGDSAGGSADTSRPLLLGLPPGGPPASDIPRRCLSQLLRDAASHPNWTRKSVRPSLPIRSWWVATCRQLC